MTVKICGLSRYNSIRGSFKSELSKVGHNVRRLGVIAEAPSSPPVQLTEREVRQIQGTLHIQIIGSAQSKQKNLIPVLTASGTAYFDDARFKELDFSVILADKNTKKLRELLFKARDEIRAEYARHRALSGIQKQKAAEQWERYQDLLERAPRPELRFDSSHSFERLHTKFKQDVSN